MVCTICVVMTEVQKQGSLNVLLLFAHICYLLPEILSLSCVECSYNRSQQDALFLNFILVKNSTCFGQTYCPSSGILILHSEQLVFVILVMLMLGSILTSLADSQHN
jgi:hypothetical protein